MRANAPRFRWSWRIAAPLGIAIDVHMTFLLLVAWVVLGEIAAGGDAALVLDSLVLLALVFACVVLHELGHALTARRFGIRTRAITLLPIGGVASLDRMPERPRDELLIALAGPAVNLALAAILVGFALPFDPAQLARAHAPVLAQLFWLDAGMAVFNLIPAFPMDGGRVLRALLATRVGALRATEIAARVGKAAALGFVAIGLWLAPTLLVIGVFIWLGADAELAGARLRAAVAGIPVGDAMLTDVATLEPTQPLRHAAELIAAGYAHDFAVVDGERVRGVLTHADVIRGLAALGPDAPITGVMHGDVASISVAAPLERALRRLERDDAGVLIVTERGRLAGLVSLASLGELLALRGALEAGLHRTRH